MRRKITYTQLIQPCTIAQKIEWLIEKEIIIARQEPIVIPQAATVPFPSI